MYVLHHRVWFGGSRASESIPVLLALAVEGVTVAVNYVKVD